MEGGWFKKFPDKLKEGHHSEQFVKHFRLTVKVILSLDKRDPR